MSIFASIKNGTYVPNMGTNMDMPIFGTLNISSIFDTNMDTVGCVVACMVRGDLILKCMYALFNALCTHHNGWKHNLLQWKDNECVMMLHSLY